MKTANYSAQPNEASKSANLIRKWGEEYSYVDLSKFLTDPFTGNVYAKQDINLSNPSTSLVGKILADPIGGEMFLKMEDNVQNGKASVESLPHLMKAVEGENVLKITKEEKNDEDSKKNRIGFAL